MNLTFVERIRLLVLGIFKDSDQSLTYVGHHTIVAIYAEPVTLMTDEQFSRPRTLSLCTKRLLK